MIMLSELKRLVPLMSQKLLRSLVGTAIAISVGTFCYSMPAKLMKAQSPTSLSKLYMMAAYELPAPRSRRFIILTALCSFDPQKVAYLIKRILVPPHRAGIPSTCCPLRRKAEEQIPPQLYSDNAPARSCQSLRYLRIPKAIIQSVYIRRPDDACYVTVIITRGPVGSRVTAYFGFPLKRWNGRFRGTGGAGYFLGDPNNLLWSISKGYAAGVADAGNADGSFALLAPGQPNWAAIRTDAYSGIHEMTVVGKQIAQIFYGKPPRYSYFYGGSTGGRQALIEAQRYPTDYDGIVALYPSIHRSRYVPGEIWPQIVMHQSMDFLPKEKLEAATAAAKNICNRGDRHVDKVISTSQRCLYDPSSLEGTIIDKTRFTATDADVVRKIWLGPRGRDGRFLWYGPTRSTDLSFSAGTSGNPPVGQPSGEALDWFKYFVVQNPRWDWRTVTVDNFQTLFDKSVRLYSPIYDSDDPNLTSFRDHGGKLLIFHGLSDQIVPPDGTIAYYTQVQRKMGGADRAEDVARLFLVPGGDHGFLASTPTPSPSDIMRSIIGWVEGKMPPNEIPAVEYGRSEHNAVHFLKPYR